MKKEAKVALFVEQPLPLKVPFLIYPDAASAKAADPWDADSYPSRLAIA